MRYVMARLEKETEDMMYRIYVTDMLRGLCQNAEIPRLYDLVYAKYERKEYRTQEEIIDSIRAKLGD